MTKWIVGMLFAAMTASSVVAAEAVATFAGGCFWCMEPPYDRLEGVTSTVSGYMGGHVKNPTYEQVSSDSTGHAEVVQVTYDPDVVSYEKLLEVFWRNVDPLDAGGQFCDRGESYRTAIFYHTQAQERAARASKEQLDESERFDRPIVTEITEAGEFYPAEDYHQNYYEKTALQVLPLALRARCASGGTTPTSPVNPSRLQPFEGENGVCPSRKYGAPGRTRTSDQ